MTTYGSLFAGAGGVDLGFDLQGWSCRWQVEIDPLALSVLVRHWPDVAHYADVRKVDGGEIEPVDVISGGFPCQDLSVAGQRAGLDGDRSSLFYEFVRIVEEMRHATGNAQPRWVVWENVVGLLGTQGALAAVYARWDEAGAMVQEHRVVDARYFGVPQRRRRVIGVVGFDPAARYGPEVLADAKGVRRDLAADGAAQAADAGRVVGDVGEGGGAGAGCGVVGQDGDVIEAMLPPVSNTVTARYYKSVNTTLDEPLVPVFAFNGSNSVDLQVSATVTPAVRVADGNGIPQIMRGDVVGVRRLTPVEVERLMGWPDDHTRWTEFGKEISNKHRYMMCGNGVVAPVAEWVARRIAMVEMEVAGGER